MKKILGLLLVKKLFVGLLMVSLLAYEQKSYAQAVPVANFVVNRAVASAVQRVAIARGFAANDPRIAATMAGMSKTSTGLNVVGTAAGVGLAVAGAPVWLGIAASLGIVGLGYGISAWVNSPSSPGAPPAVAEIKIMSTATGNQLHVETPVKAPPPYVAPAIGDTTPRWAQALMAGAPMYRSPYSCFTGDACFALPLPPETPTYRFNFTDDGKIIVAHTDPEVIGQYYLWKIGITPGASTTHTVWHPESQQYVTYSSGGEYRGVQVHTNSEGDAKITVYIRHWSSGGDAYGYPSYDSVSGYANAASSHGQIGPKVFPSLQDAITTLQQQLGNAKVSEETLARIVDQIWQRAASQPDYEGLPYSVTQPVTAPEIGMWTAENPSAVPTVGDLLAPASNPGTQLVPISPTASPGTSPDPGTSPTPTPSSSGDVNVINTPNVNVVNRINVDFGHDPGLQAPDLEQAPQAWDIFEPVISSVESFAFYRVPNHPSECPKPTFDMWSDPIVMDGHCKLLDEVKPTLFTVMAAVWVVIGCFIILAA